MSRSDNSSYQQVAASDFLEPFVNSFWEHKNNGKEDQSIMIFPDGFFKIVLFLDEKGINKSLLTGIWQKEIPITIPANSRTLGIRFKILGPEFLLKRRIAYLLNLKEGISIEFLDLDPNITSSLEAFSQHMERLFSNWVKDCEVEGKKMRLSQLLDKTKGDITAEEVSNQIGWSNRQINRYLQRFIGVSLKSYINIQRVYDAYIQIREGRFFPDKMFYDQAHFIREVKKHTSFTPTQLHKEQDDRFIQLKNIQKK